MDHSDGRECASGAGVSESAVENWAVQKRRELRDNIARSRWLAAGGVAKEEIHAVATFGADTEFDGDVQQMDSALQRASEVSTELAAQERAVTCADGARY